LSDEEEQRQNWCEGYLISGHLVHERVALYNGARLCSSCKAGMQHDYRKSHRDHRKKVSQLNDDVAKFASQEGIGVKCMSDRILLYCRYSVSTLTDKVIEEHRRRWLESCDRIYQNIRGDMAITNKNPRTMAGAVVYIAAILAGIPVSQTEVAKSLDMTEKTIHDNYMVIRSFLKL
jgi:hypothetical protein